MLIDHVIYGVRDLDAAAARFDALGLTSYAGGSHPGLGTSNRIVPLGPSYIELLAPAPFDDRFIGWMLRGVQMPDDAIPVERVTPDGRTLRWRLAGIPAGSLWDAGTVPPVLIEWAEGTTLPGQAARPVGSLESVTLDRAGALVSVAMRLTDGTPVVIGPTGPTHP